MNFQTIDYYSQQPTQMTPGILSKSIQSTKRKLEDDTAEEFTRLKRPHFIHNSSAVSLLQEEIIEEEKDVSKRYMSAVPCASPKYNLDNFRLPATSLTNEYNDTTINTFDAITPPAEDAMMIEDDYTDEDESLKTPSYVNSLLHYIPMNMEDDLDEDGYTGQLERGWVEMYYDMISEL